MTSERCPGKTERERDILSSSVQEFRKKKRRSEWYKKEKSSTDIVSQEAPSISRILKRFAAPNSNRFLFTSLRSTSASTPTSAMLSTKTLVFILAILLAISTVSSVSSGGNKCGRILMGHIDAICGKDCDESAAINLIAMFSNNVFKIVLICSILLISAVNSAPEATGRKCGRQLLNYIWSICAESCANGDEIHRLCTDGSRYTDSDVKALCCP
ncbi:CRE-INS-27 protein [Caenorhabditis remanei]|uniref:CRE-INS-27 protein n=1 Tax=Caenorhabditis remanei TaxID=31234 RepID=E3NAJ2_CAERE|nr:CRE-INS-27 protein [Caenorhabditis remanei]